MIKFIVSVIILINHFDYKRIIEFNLKENF